MRKYILPAFIAMIVAFFVTLYLAGTVGMKREIVVVDKTRPTFYTEVVEK